MASLQSPSAPQSPNPPTKLVLDRVQNAADLFAKQLRDAGFEITIPTIRAKETVSEASRETSDERGSPPDEDNGHQQGSRESSDEVIMPRKRVVIREDVTYQEAQEVDEEEEYDEDNDSELLVAAGEDGAGYGDLEADHPEEAEDCEEAEDYEEAEYPDTGESSESPPVMIQRCDDRTAATAEEVSATAGGTAVASQSIFKKTNVRLTPHLPDSRAAMQRKRNSLSPRHLRGVETRNKNMLVPVSVAADQPDPPEYAFQDEESPPSEPARRKTTMVGLRREEPKKHGKQGEEKSRAVERKLTSKNPLYRASQAATATGVGAKMKEEILKSPLRSRSPLPATYSPNSIPSTRLETLGKQATAPEERNEDAVFRTKSGRLQQTLKGRRNGKQTNDMNGGGQKDRKNTMSRLFGRNRPKDEGERDESPAKEVLPAKSRSPNVLETETERQLRHQREKLDSRERKTAEAVCYPNTVEQSTGPGGAAAAAAAAGTGAMAVAVHPTEQSSSPQRQTNHYYDPVDDKPVDAKLEDMIVERRERRKHRRREREERRRAEATENPHDSEDALINEFSSDKNDVLMAARARAENRSCRKAQSGAAASGPAADATADSARAKGSGDKEPRGRSRNIREHDEARRLRREARRKRRAAEKAEAATTEKMRRSLGTTPKSDSGTQAEQAGAAAFGAAADREGRKNSPPRPQILPPPPHSIAAAEAPEYPASQKSGDVDVDDGPGSPIEIPIRSPSSSELQQIDEDMREVLQQHPESFRPPPLLYVPVAIGGVSLGAVVDTAAQASFITLSSARRVGLEQLVDQRFGGNASGNASRSGGIVGRIHICTMIVGTTAVRCSLAVSENGPTGRATKMPDVVIGADVLLNTNAILDLKRKRLVLGQDKTALQLNVM